MTLKYDDVYGVAVKLLSRLHEFEGAVLIGIRKDGNVEAYAIGQVRMDSFTGDAEGHAVRIEIDLTRDPSP